MSVRKLWLAFGLVVVLSFAVLGWTGVRIYQQAPPVPDRVVTTDGRQLIGPGDIHDGQNVWQSMGGMEVGSIARERRRLLPISRTTPTSSRAVGMSTRFRQAP